MLAEKELLLVSVEWIIRVTNFRSFVYQRDNQIPILQEENQELKEQVVQLKEEVKLIDYYLEVIDDSTNTKELL